MLSPYHIARARFLRQRLWSWEAIAQQFHCKEETVKRALDPSWCGKKRDAARRLKVEQQREVPVSDSKPRAPFQAKDIAPKELLLERERAMLAPRSLTAEAFGDPPAGRSALDRRARRAP